MGPDAFERFYEREFIGLTRLAYVLTRSPGVAEDLAQETMLRAYRHWAKVSEYDNPNAWARRVLCNLACSRGRRLASEARAVLRLRGVAQPTFEPPTELDEIAHALRQLPRHDAEAVALFYLEDMSIADIAAMLDCAEGTVKARLHRGRHALGTLLDAPTKDSL